MSDRRWILAIDYGQKRTGVAEADDDLRIPFPLEAVQTRYIWSFLKDYMAKKKLILLVVGIPCSTYGMTSHILGDVLQFVEKFSQIYPNISVYKQDERFSSKIAFREFILPVYKKKKRKDKFLIDKVSASLILSFYFESRGES